MSAQVESLETTAFSMDYLRFGSGGEPLVILPGLSVQSVMGAAGAVEEAYAPLAGDFTLYLLDQRKNLPDRYSVGDMARDAHEAICALELGRVCLFGVSMGGMVALQLALDHPGSVRKLALGSAAVRVPRETRRLFEKWAVLAMSGDAAALYLAFGEAIYPPCVFERYRAQLVGAAKAVTPEELRRFAVLARGIEGFDVAARLGEIACPVCAIGSSDDCVFGPESTLEIADGLCAMPGFELHIYDGYGHAAYDLAPDYKDRLRRFFAA